nr:family 43 glycosylhydrolase [Sphingomonas crusticola]
MEWRRGLEGQRKADLGNGSFLNPVFAGDHPDPTILKDGSDYYMTFSSFDAYPGVVVWHSRDLVNWRPLGPALKTYIGSVWACDIAKHGDRYFIYIPAQYSADRKSVYVIHADSMAGPWSEPIDLHLNDAIDPGHAVGQDGTRYLFLNHGRRVRLTADGLKTAGPVETVYEPWRYPVTWDVEGFASEGPKITRRGDYYYLVMAVGGTAGPPTGHMVIAARSKTIDGPWEHAPNNPIVHTACASEKWWSRGHATLVEGPTPGDWYAVYHGYENGYWTLGRQMLLDKVEWTADGWFRCTGGDLSKPLRIPAGGRPGPHGLALSDDFSDDRSGVQWSFANPKKEDAGRVRRENGALVLRGSGTAPRDSTPLTFLVGDQAYEADVEVDVDPGVDAGVVLFYDRVLYCGLGFDKSSFITHQYGEGRRRPINPNGTRQWIRMRNHRHILTFFTSVDGQNWTKMDRQMEVSGYNHNVRGGFFMLRPGLYAVGDGEARFRNLTYRALA